MLDGWYVGSRHGKLQHKSKAAVLSARRITWRCNNQLNGIYLNEKEKMGNRG